MEIKTPKKSTQRVRVTESSGNVFADLGLPNPKRELTKAHLTLEIYRIIKRRGMTQTEAAKALGIKVYTIGAGTRGFAPMPMRDPFGRTVYQNVKVDVDEETLQKIADLTGAKFYRATDTKTLNQIFEQIDKLEKSTVEMNQYTQYRELYPWFLDAGFALLALHLLLGQTVGKKLP